MAHVIVTGGLGFIGSHVADAYLAAGWQVTLIDSGTSAVTDGAGFAGHPRCTLHRLRVEDFLKNGGSFRGADRVIHAASPVGPVRLLPWAGRLGPEMVRVAEAVIEECIRADAALCVFSSAEVYGHNGLLAESDDIRIPSQYNARIEYAAAKMLIEVMTTNCRRQHGLRAIVLRPFNVAGPRQSPAGGFVIPTFVQQALAGEPLTVFGDGSQVRAFLAVADLVRFLLEFMDAALAKTGITVYNLGNPSNAVTMRELAELVTELAGSCSPIVQLDGRQVHGPLYAEAESREKVPVISRAAELGWQPHVGLRDLVRETIAYCRSTRPR